MDREVAGNNSNNSTNKAISFGQKIDLFRPYYIAIINYNIKNVENNNHDKMPILIIIIDIIITIIIIIIKM